MSREPIISRGRKKRSIGIAAGLILTGVILTCALLPAIVFADDPVVLSGRTHLTDSFDASIAPEQKVRIDELQEQRLISLLMKDTTVTSYKRIIDDEHWKVVKMRVTGYCPCSQCCGVFSDGITANNHRIQPGDTFAAADKSYPFGTEMVIPGYNASQSVEVMDRGGAIKGNRLDLFFHTHQQALQWGVQYLDVLIKIKQ